ncbi:DUF4328 domain-containing protein [Kribbella deserti]|uniref:DUF4328 domain-containing protein n=1 Tax=Kribbella deserti TaxID=1926257 RepID=A0ABV6QTS3_9ACTN
MRSLGIAAIVLIGLTMLGALYQTFLMWQWYPDIKRIVFGLSNEDEVLAWTDSLTDSGPLANLASLLFLATAVTFLVWLWQARETTEALDPNPQPQPGQSIYQRPRGVHRLDQGWVIGSWFCPIVQYWYPLRIVQDVDTGSRPPGEVAPGRDRGLIYAWWTGWTTYWTISFFGAIAAVITFFVWMVQFVSDVEAAEASGAELDVYGLQDALLKFVLALFIGATVAMAGMLLAAVTMSLLILQISGRLERRLTTPPAPPVQPQGPRPVDQPFPNYQQHPQQSHGNPQQSPYRF